MRARKRAVKHVENQRLELQKLIFNIDIMGALKRHVAIISLVSFTVITRLLLIINSPFIYHFDSYKYISEAIDLSSAGKIQFGAGAPFVISLGVLFYIFGSTLGVILVSRLLMLLMSSLLVCIIYLFGLRISGKILGFIAALLTIFEPLFLSYSIVPHNDIFVVAMGLAALYLATSENVKFHYFLSLIPFYIAIFTRPEFLMVLVFPILIFSLLKHLKAVSVRTTIELVFSSSLFVLPFIWVYSLHPRVTRFSPIQKFSLFLKPELLQLTLESLFKFYDQTLLDQIFFALVGLGGGWALLNTFGKFVVFEKRGKTFSVKRKKDKSIREVFLSDGVMVAFCLFLLFLIHIIVLTVYGYGYVIVDGTLIIRKWFPDRYLILTRLLLSYPLAYVLSMVVQEVYAGFVQKK